MYSLVVVAANPAGSIKNIGLFQPAVEETWAEVNVFMICGNTSSITKL